MTMTDNRDKDMSDQLYCECVHPPCPPDSHNLAPANFWLSLVVRAKLNMWEWVVGTLSTEDFCILFYEWLERQKKCKGV